MDIKDRCDMGWFERLIRNHRNYGGFSPEQKKAGFWLSVDNRGGIWSIISRPANDPLVDEHGNTNVVPAVVFVKHGANVHKLALDLYTQFHGHAP